MGSTAESNRITSFCSGLKLDVLRLWNQMAFLLLFLPLIMVGFQGNKTVWNCKIAHLKTLSGHVQLHLESSISPRILSNLYTAYPHNWVDVSQLETEIIYEWSKVTLFYHTLFVYTFSIFDCFCSIMLLLLNVY